jgi:hypothetical protein
MTEFGASACEQGSTHRVALLTRTHAQAQGPAMIDSVEAALSSNRCGPFGFQALSDMAVEAAETLTIFDTTRSVIRLGPVCRPIHTRPHPSARTSTRAFLNHRQ